MGKVEIVDKMVIATILDDVQSNIFDKTGSLYTMCFDPRHGLRVEAEQSVKDF